MAFKLPRADLPVLRDAISIYLLPVLRDTISHLSGHCWLLLLHTCAAYSTQHTGPAATLLLTWSREGSICYAVGITP